jgi:hypothetical protein
MAVGAKRHTRNTSSATLDFESLRPRGGVRYEHQPIRGGRRQATIIRAEGRAPVLEPGVLDRLHHAMDAEADRLQAG